MRAIQFLLCFLFVAPAFAGVKIRVPVWYVALTCEHDPVCYASSNGSYTGSIGGARKFYNSSDANAFVGSLTESIREKSPRLIEGSEFKCVESTKEKLNGPPC